MSRTDSPPLVRSCVSCWKTFTVRSPSSGCRRPRLCGQAYFARFSRKLEMEADLVAGVGGRRLGRAGVRVLRRRTAACGSADADGDLALHAEGLVPVDRAVHFVRALLRK